MKELKEAIYTKLKEALPSHQEKIFYMYLPHESFLNGLSVTYTLENTSNQSFYDAKDAIRTYNLEININDTNTNFLDNASIYIREKINSLRNNVVSIVQLIDEQEILDSETNLISRVLRFELKI